MPKFLLQVDYTASGLQGVLKEGGSGRRTAAEQTIQSVGGEVESFYFAFGEPDAYLIADFPDATAAAAAAMNVSAAGSVTVRTVVLLTPEEVDEAAQRQVEYRPPGA